MSRDDLILLTQNKHKLKELTPLFEEYHVPFRTTTIEKTEIRADDVEQVALAAAKAAFHLLKTPVVLDDTGLYIDALGGFPRAYPAFVLNTIGKAGILKLMLDTDNRRATFVTAVGYADSLREKTFVGKMEGTISFREAGDEGFGYDPIFVPTGYECTYAQLSFREKTGISHRTRAFRAFLDWFTGTLDNP
jgi:XTP/dITP diphosphohydrolase